MDDQQGTIAVGVAFLAVLGAIWGAVEVLGTIESDGAPELATMCSQPVEIVEAGQSRLGCADESLLSQCEGLDSGDRAELAADTCEIHRGAMAAAMKLHVGLPLDINQASAAELMLISGIGPKLSEAIVKHRIDHGAFGSIELLQLVDGIGEAKLEKLRSALVINGSPIEGDEHDRTFKKKEAQ